MSSADQNLTTQPDALERLGCHQIFQDKITGTSISRRALDELPAKLRSGGQVVVARFNRLGRDRNHLINLLNKFSVQGIQFRALDLGVGSFKPVGKMVFQVFAALAECDRTGHLVGRYLGENAGRTRTGQS